MNDGDFRSLYDMYYNDVHRFVHGHVHHQADVEDIIQNTFIQVARSFSNLRDHTHIRTWILRISHNQIQDYYRKKQREKDRQRPLDAIEETASGSDPVADIINDDLRRHVYRLIDTLSLNTRTVLVCRLYQDLSHNEISTILGFSSVRIRVIYSRGIARLRKMVENDPYFTHFISDTAHKRGTV